MDGYQIEEAVRRYGPGGGQAAVEHGGPPRRPVLVPGDGARGVFCQDRPEVQ
ncbi:hypothetical protein [Wenjunlia vitaminophila]|uniref:hypothetical protein n=1 Tax=Wenjunlia vitaminophila TaxID=76728 RepID=UPI0003603431|nr:hypothetical protein [Wenjunlia vitaminophila]